MEYHIAQPIGNEKVISKHTRKKRIVHQVCNPYLSRSWPSLLRVRHHLLLLPLPQESLLPRPRRTPLLHLPGSFPPQELLSILVPSSAQEHHRRPCLCCLRSVCEP